MSDGRNEAIARAGSLDPDAWVSLRWPVLANESIPLAARQHLSIFWDTTAFEGELGARSVGSGVAFEISAAGADRFARIAEQGTEALGRVVRFGGADPRLFGGFSFEAENPAAEWRRFGEASFLVPRWLEESTAEGTFRTLTVRAGELARASEPARAAALFAELSTARDTPMEESREARLEVDPSFTGIVERALERIAGGDLEKVVLARRTRVVSEGLVAARAIEAIEGQRGVVRFGFFRGSTSFIGATPERLVTVRGEVALVDAVAGTRSRSGSDDESERQALLGSDKDQREHALVARDIARILARHSRTDGPAPLPSPMVRSLRHLHHLVTPFETRVARGASVVRIAGDLHPTPAMAGWPTSGARSFIREYEGFARGWYASPIGHFNASGEGSFFVGIRSALVEPNGAWVFGGAGIVRGSKPPEEWIETGVKQRGMLDALGVTR